MFFQKVVAAMLPQWFSDHCCSDNDFFCPINGENRCAAGVLTFFAIALNALNASPIIDPKSRKNALKRTFFQKALTFNSRIKLRWIPTSNHRKPLSPKAFPAFSPLNSAYPVFHK